MQRSPEQGEADQHQQDPGAGLERQGDGAKPCRVALRQPQREPARADRDGGDRRVPSARCPAPSRRSTPRRPSKPRRRRTAAPAAPRCTAGCRPPVRWTAPGAATSRHRAKPPRANYCGRNHDHPRHDHDRSGHVRDDGDDRDGGGDHDDDGRGRPAPAPAEASAPAGGSASACHSSQKPIPAMRR